MPESHTSNRYLKPLTIAAILLIVIVVVPYAVIEKARRDAEKSLAMHDEHLEFDSIEFDRESWVLFKFKGIPDTPDPESYTSSAVWSLYPWEFSESTGEMRGDYMIISDYFTQSDSEIEDGELSDSKMIENDHSDSDAEPPLDEDLKNDENAGQDSP